MGGIDSGGEVREEGMKLGRGGGRDGRHEKGERGTAREKRKGKEG